MVYFIFDQNYIFFRAQKILINFSYFYGKDPESYFVDNSLIYNILSDCDLIVAGGDLNSRTKEDPDFIPTIDGNTAPRNNPDQVKIGHGDFFLQFLKNNRALICNGRITPEKNDFTYISPRGCSVPDYIYCPADHIQYCTSVNILKVSDAINKFHLDVPFSLSDLSILISEFDLSCSPPFITRSTPSLNTSENKAKKNIRKID